MDDKEIFEHLRNFYVSMNSKEYGAAFEHFKMFDRHVFKTTNNSVLTFYFSHVNEYFHDELMFFYQLCNVERSGCKLCKWRCYDHQHELTLYEYLKLQGDK